jgi:DNA primase
MTSPVYAEIKANVPFMDFAGRNCPASKMDKVGADTVRLIPCPLCGSEKGCTIYPGTDSYRCFACDTAGDVIKFAANLFGMTNREAADRIADEYHLSGGNGNGSGRHAVAAPPAPRPEYTPKEIDRAPGIDSERAYELRRFAARLYQKNLLDGKYPVKDGKTALEYLGYERKHTIELIRDNMVGVAQGNLKAAAEKAGYTVDDFVSVGLMKPLGRGFGEVIRKGMIVHPHIYKGLVQYFTIKDPTKKHEYQIKKMYTPPDWLCLGQESMEEASLFITEGENDRLAIMRAGYTNVIATNGNYNNSAILAHIKENAKGKVFWLAFDNDIPKKAGQKPAGQRYTEKYTRAILDGGGTAHALAIPEGKDIDDVLREADNPKAVLEELMHNAGECRLPPEPGDDDTPDRYCFRSFEVLGELSNGDLAFWSREKNCNYFRSIKELTLDQLVQIGGKEVAWRVVPNQKAMQEYLAKEEEKGNIDVERTHDRVIFTALKKRIILEAGENRMPKLDKIGQGIHRLGENQAAIINGGSAYLWDGMRFTKQEHPLIKNKLLIEFEKGAEWIDMEALKRETLAMDHEKAAALKMELLQKFQQWRFKGKYDARLLTGYTLAQPIQSLWEWRPHLWLSGSSTSGKTKLNQFMKAIFRDLLLDCQGSNLTEPGFRQAIGENSCLAYIDEFEKNNDREKIIALLRMSGRGGTGRKWGADGPMSFTMRHMVFVSSIEIGTNRAAENSRFLQIETKKDDTCKPVIPGNAEGKAIQRRIIAYSLWAGFKAIAAIKAIEKDLNRWEESIAVPFAVTHVSSNNFMNPESLLKTVKAYSEEWEEHHSGDLEEDEELLITEIFNSKIKVNETIVGDRDRIVMVERLVSQILFSDDGIEDPGHVASLEANGVKRHYEDGSVFFYPKAIQRYLMKGTPWAGMNIKNLLLRIDGAEWTKYRIGGKYPYGVSIPYIHFVNKGLC